jgi:TolB protein
MTRVVNSFRLVFLIAALMVTVLFATNARAELTVDITQGNVEPLPIAVPDFLPSDDAARRFSIDIAQVVADDLERSGLFRPIDKRAFYAKPQGLGVKPRFANWKPLNAQALVVGEVGIEPNGALRASFRLWDVFAENQMTGLSLTTTQANWRRVAHIIADTIYERITGEVGYFDTRIVYPRTSASRGSRSWIRTGPIIGF